MADSKEESEFIEADTIADHLRKSQNQMIAMVVLYVVAIIVYFTGRSEELGAFEYLILLFVLANTVYLAVEFWKYFDLKKKEKEELGIETEE